MQSNMLVFAMQNAQGESPMQAREVKISREKNNLKHFYFFL